MDLMTIFGLIAGIGSVYYVMAEGNILHMLLNPVAAVLVFGGTFSATLIAYPWEVIKYAAPSFRFIFLSQKNNETYRQRLIDQIVHMAEKARRAHVESLQGEIRNIDNGLLAYGMQMVVDGYEPKVVNENMQKEMISARQLNQRVSGVFRTMATLSPIFGLLGTLIGVVQVLRNLSDPTNMGSAMAIAITTTFYGIFAANFLFLPVSIKLNEHGEGEVTSNELVTEGVLAIQQGDLPLIVRKKLNAFMMSRMEGVARSSKG
jgi:chemotaxis protein MotA